MVQKERNTFDQHKIDTISIFPSIDFMKKPRFFSFKNTCLPFVNVLKFLVLSPSNVGHIRYMHARPHCRKGQLPLRSLRDLGSR